MTAWRWQSNTSALLTTSLPGMTTFDVNAAGETIGGVDWPLPSELPLPGFDIFASPLGHVEGWSRTDGEGVALAYQLRSPATAGHATLIWSVVRPQFTTSGDPITVGGRGAVTVISHIGWWAPPLTAVDPRAGDLSAEHPVGGGNHPGVGHRSCEDDLLGAIALVA